MEWGAKKQALYALIVIAAIGAVVALISFAVLYKPATCFDGIKNQDEVGVDCEGVCSRLCTAPNVTALWARSVKVADGVYHAVAMVQNPETAAGTDTLPYTFSLYDAGNILIAERDGVMKLQPGEVVPLLETNIVTGSRTPARTFISFGPTVWNKMERAENPLTITDTAPDWDNLRLSAQVRNSSVADISKAVLTALVYDAQQTLIGASQTVVTDIPARGNKTATFTWQEPFASPAVRADITARVQ